jgi:hypothetical protein
MEAAYRQQHDRQRCQPPPEEQLVLEGKELPVAQLEGHSSMCRADSSAAKKHFCKHKIKVSQLGDNGKNKLQ